MKLKQMKLKTELEIFLFEFLATHLIVNSAFAYYNKYHFQYLIY